MTCSGIEGIDEDFVIQELPPIPIEDQKTIWNGRIIQVLHEACTLIQMDKILASISQHYKEDPHFYERLFIDLTFEDLEDTEEDAREWEFALAQPFFPTNNSENLTLEQFLEKTGMIFDQQLGQYIDCKCWFMKMAHSAEKKVRKVAKKTVHFVKEHKKEIAIGVAVVVGTAVLGAVGAAIAQAIIATDTASTIGGTIAAAAKAADEVNKYYERKEAKEDRRAQSVDSDKHPSSIPRIDPPSSYAFTPPPSAGNDLMKQVFGNLLPSNPTPPPHHGIYALDADNKHTRDVSVPPSALPPFRVEASPPSFPPSGNIAQQFFNKVFQANPNLNPYTNSGKVDTEKPQGNLPTASPEISAQAPSAPNPFKSDFGTYLNNLHRSQIDANYQQYTQASETPAIPPVNSAIEHAGINNMPPETSVASASTAFKSDFGTYLDNLHRSQVSSNFENALNGTAKSNAPLQSDSNVPEHVRVESWNKAEALVNMLSYLKQSMETIGRGMIEKELLDPDSPLDPFNAYYGRIESHDPALREIKTTDLALLPGEIPLPMIFDLPAVPNVGVIPIMSSKGETYLLSVCADKNRFKWTQEELDKGSINLFDHLRDFLPKNGEQIALFTSINGINTSLKEFGEHCQADNDLIAVIMSGDPSQEDYEHPLYLGLYNNTEGFLNDLIRACKGIYHGKQSDAPLISAPDDIASGMLQIAKDSIPDFQGFTEGIKDFFINSAETQNIEIAREFLSKIATTAKEINNEFRWVIIEHSEGGLVYCKSFEGMSKGVKEIMHENTLNIALGSAEPISSEMASKAVNFYSDKDHVTKRFAEKFMNDPNYDIRIIPCKSSRGELSFFIADHARDGTTYMEAKEDQLKEIKDKQGFYDGKEHE